VRLLRRQAQCCVSDGTEASSLLAARFVPILASTKKKRSYRMTRGGNLCGYFFPGSTFFIYREFPSQPLPQSPCLFGGGLMLAVQKFALKPLDPLLGRIYTSLLKILFI